MSAINNSFSPSDALTQGWLQQVTKETEAGSAKVLTVEEQKERSAKLEKACKDFESVFISMMFKEMRKTVQKTELMGKTSMTEELFTGMIDDEVSKSFANRGGIGLWKMLYKQMAPTAGVTREIAEKAYGG
jgi:flagellar protein FlgJ